jgi:hypothetical protein
MFRHLESAEREPFDPAEVMLAFVYMYMGVSSLNAGIIKPGAVKTDTTPGELRIPGDTTVRGMLTGGES